MSSRSAATRWRSTPPTNSQHPRPAARPRQRRRGGRRRVRGAAGRQGRGLGGRPGDAAPGARTCPSSTNSPPSCRAARARATSSPIRRVRLLLGAEPPLQRQQVPEQREREKGEAAGHGRRGGAEEDVGDQHDRPGHRQRQGAEAGDREAVGEEDELVLLLVAEGEPVVGGGRDQQHRGDRGQQQRHEVDVLLEGRDLGEVLLERDRQQEGEEDLDARAARPAAPAAARRGCGRGVPPRSRPAPTAGSIHGPSPYPRRSEDRLDPLQPRPARPRQPGAGGGGAGRAHGAALRLRRAAARARASRRRTGSPSCARRCWTSTRR